MPKIISVLEPCKLCNVWPILQPTIPVPTNISPQRDAKRVIHVADPLFFSKLISIDPSMNQKQKQKREKEKEKKDTNEPQIKPFQEDRHAK